MLKTVQNFCTQASLTLAYRAYPIPFAVLPLAANCSIPDGGSAIQEAVASCDPAIIHYHDRVASDGCILAGSNLLAARRIAVFNDRLTKDSHRARGSMPEA